MSGFEAVDFSDCVEVESTNIPATTLVICSVTWDASIALVANCETRPIDENLGLDGIRFLNKRVVPKTYF